MHFRLCRLQFHYVAWLTGDNSSPQTFQFCDVSEDLGGYSEDSRR